MPKFNEFIKGFEEKETATKPQEPKVQTAPNVEGQGDHKVTQTFYNLSDKGEWEQSGEPKITMANKERVGTILSDNAQPFEQSHRLYKQGKGKEKFDTYESISPDGKRKSVWSVEFPQTELGSKQEQPAPQKQEEPNSLDYEGYRLERTPDGKWINRDTYEYFDNKVEAQKDIDKFIASQRLGKPKDDENGQRIVNYGGKDMTFEEAKELYKKSVAIPTLKSTPEREKYLDKSAEYDIAQDELYKKWYEEKDPQKKAELKEQLDKLDKEYESFLNEWEEAERNRYKKD